LLRELATAKPATEKHHYRTKSIISIVEDESLSRTS